MQLVQVLSNLSLENWALRFPLCTLARTLGRPRPFEHVKHLVDPCDRWQAMEASKEALKRAKDYLGNASHKRCAHLRKTEELPKLRGHQASGVLPTVVAPCRGGFAIGVQIRKVVPALHVP
jgi:hypothetical protein